MTSKNPARSCEDIDDSALSFAEVKALATGDPRIKEKMDLDIQIANLRTLKSDYLAQRYSFEDALAKRIPQKIQAVKVSIQKMTTAISALEKHPVSAENFAMTIGGNVYTERKAAGAEIIRLCLSDDRPEGLIGSFRGFEMHLHFDELAKQFKMELKNGMILSTEISDDEVGTVNRISNALERIPQYLAEEKAELDGLQAEAATIRAALEKPFEYAAELEQKEERMTVLMHELAEAEKEQSAKRALKKSLQTQQGQDAPVGGSAKSITEFLRDFQPQPTAENVVSREHSMERS